MRKLSSISVLALLAGFLAWQNWQVNAQAPQHGATVTWIASTTPSVTGYLVYRSPTSGGPYSQLNATPVAALTYFDPTGALNGATEFYVIDAIDSLGVESAHSTQVSAVTIGDPKAPTNPAVAIK